MQASEFTRGLAGPWPCGAPGCAPGGALCGAVGLGPAAAAAFDAWARGQGAGLIGFTDGGGVWAIGTPFGGLAPIRGEPVPAAGPAPADAAGGWLLGDLFAPPAAVGSAAGGWLAAAWQRDGEAAVFQPEGQFAVVHWDGRRGALVLYRDETSAQSICYHQRADGGLVFADRLALLARCPLVRIGTEVGIGVGDGRGAPVGGVGLAEYLRLFDISPPHTPYLGIRALEPGQRLRWRRGGIELAKRPAPTLAPTPLPDPPRRLDAAADALRARLAEAVRQRLDPSGETLVFLSGGVDSACLCALAAAEGRARVQAVTVGFAEPTADEAAVAAGIAAHLGVRHRVLRFDLDAYRAAFDALAAGADAPFADPAAAATLLCYRYAVTQGAVALDGTGADTLLGLMPARHQRLAVAWGARLPVPLRRALVRAMAPVPRLRDYRPLVDFDEPEAVLTRWHGFSRAEIERLTGAPADLDQTRFYQLFRAFPRGAHFARYSALMGNLPDDRLHQAAALTGLKVRMPFFADAVVALVGALPRDLRWRPHETKRVLRAVLARDVPRRLWDGPKHGFDFPFDALLAHQDYALVRTWLDPERVAACGLLDPDAVRGLAGRFIAGDRRERFRVWGLVVLFAWLGHHTH